MVSYIDCRAKPYHAAIARHFIASAADGSPRLDEIIINFGNTSVYWNRGGYTDLMGTFEEVDDKGRSFLVSNGLQIFDHSGQPKRCEQEISPIRMRDIGPDPALSDMNVFILVPIFGSPKFTSQVVANLVRIEDELTELNAKLVFGIDGHIGREAALHRQIIETANLPRAAIHEHPQNLGFVGNSNFLFREASDADLIVLWTSDVEVQRTTLSRCLSPLVSDPMIALATPWAFGGHNLEVPHMALQDWQGCDSFLSHSDPTYPDAETTVGYFMALDRRKYRHETLFDPAFENGYGDDSDLYYRVTNLGFRGVLIDNACVFHDDGGSFSLLEERAELQARNLSTFRDRWDTLYRQRISSAANTIQDARNCLSEGSSFAALPQYSDPRLIFVLPTNDRRIGGVASVFNICEAMQRDGFACSIVCTSRPVSEDSYRLKSIPVHDEQQLNAALRHASMIVATSYDTATVVKGLARRLQIRSAYFVQGPEYSFDGGAPLGAVMTTYQGFDELWAVSAFLESTLERWLGRDIARIPYGPGEHDYFETGAPREEKSIALQFNGRMEKGADYAAAVIAELVRHGYRFYAFGDEAARGQNVNLTRQMGFLTYSEKVALFNRVEFVMDTSHFEGLGLILMEGIRCGARPLYRLTGGTAALLEEAECGFRLPDYGRIGDVPWQLDQYLSTSDPASDIVASQAAISAHSIEAAVAAIKERVHA